MADRGAGVGGTSGGASTGTSQPFLTPGSSPRVEAVYLPPKEESWLAWVFCCCPPRKNKTVERRPLLQGLGPTSSNTGIVDLNTAAGRALAQMTLQGTDVAGGKWTSEVIVKLWPFLSKAVEKLIWSELPTALNSNLPGWMADILLDRCNLGNEPPTITAIHVDDDYDEGVDEVRVELALLWKSQTSDIQFTVQPLPAQLGKYMKLMPGMVESVVKFMTSFVCGVQNLHVQANVLLKLTPLRDQIPVVSSLQLSLTRVPYIDFNITLTRGETQVLNIFKPWLLRTVSSAITAAIVVPEHITIPIEPNIPDVMNPTGMLMVRVVSALEVPKMDWVGHSDTYVNLWVRQRIRRRTTIIHNNANPAWDRQNFQLLVHTRHYQLLTLELWDSDNDYSDSQDDYIGTAIVPLRKLTPGREEQLTLQVRPSPHEGDEEEQGVGHANQAGPDVSRTKLNVVVRYVPVALSHDFPEVGHPGVFQLKVAKVTVPDLRSLPLRLRASLLNQDPPAGLPTSPYLRPPSGSTSLEVPLQWDAVFDVLGQEADVELAVMVVEVIGIKDAGFAKFMVPLHDVRQCEHPSGVCWGGPVMLTKSGFSIEAEAWWHPMQVPHRGGSRPSVFSAIKDLVKNAATKDDHDSKDAVQDDLDSVSSSSFASPTGSLKPSFDNQQEQQLLHQHQQQQQQQPQHQGPVLQPPPLQEHWQPGEVQQQQQPGLEAALAPPTPEKPAAVAQEQHQYSQQQQQQQQQPIVLPAPSSQQLQQPQQPRQPLDGDKPEEGTMDQLSPWKDHGLL